MANEPTNIKDLIDRTEANYKKKLPHGAIPRFMDWVFESRLVKWLWWGD